MSSRYRLHAIFSSLQGEGRNVGRPATFIRFSTCNLACSWCDTHKNEKMQATTFDILRHLKEFGNKSVIITGGEPTIQPDIDELLLELKAEGYWLALETNGVVAPSRPELYDYIAVSPKPQYLSRYLDDTMLHEANEVRIVATTDEIVAFCRVMRRCLVRKIFTWLFFVSCRLKSCSTICGASSGEKGVRMVTSSSPSRVEA